MEDMAEGIQFAHEHGVKVYVTANILAHNGDLEGVREYFIQLKEIKPDALIIPTRVFIPLQKKSARKSSVISVPRPIIPTMERISSGGTRAQSVW